MHIFFTLNNQLLQQIRYKVATSIKAHHRFCYTSLTVKIINYCHRTANNLLFAAQTQQKPSTKGKQLKQKQQKTEIQPSKTDDNLKNGPLSPVSQLQFDNHIEKLHVSSFYADTGGIYRLRKKFIRLWGYPDKTPNKKKKSSRKSSNVDHSKQS